MNTLRASSASFLRQVSRLNVGASAQQYTSCTSSATSVLLGSAATKSVPASSTATTAVPDRIKGIPTNEEALANFPSDLLGFTPGKDKKLFTPGPLGVSLTTKQAMLRDLGSRDVAFMRAVKEIRAGLVKLAQVDEKDYTTILIQGSGTFAVEATIQTAVPRQGGKMLIFTNGAYGHRISKIADYLNIPNVVFEFAENEKAPVKELEKVMAAHPDATMVTMVHCETSSGVINPIVEVGKLVRKKLPNAVYFVDAMSSFGGVPLNMKEAEIDFLVSSANKCIEGTPGFSYTIARRAALAKCKGNSRSLSLDLYDQNNYMDQTGQFRFTPATHSMLSFHQALKELELEGGPDARARRYQENRRVLREGMARLGFRELLDDSHEGYIITSFHFPKHPNFSFEKFYTLLNQKNFVIYPGKVTRADCFRVGSIGHLFPQDMKNLLVGIEKTLQEMSISAPIQEQP